MSKNNLKITNLLNEGFFDLFEKSGFGVLVYDFIYNTEIKSERTKNILKYDDEDEYNLLDQIVYLDKNKLPEINLLDYIKSKYLDNKEILNLETLFINSYGDRIFIRINIQYVVTEIYQEEETLIQTDETKKISKKKLKELSAEKENIKNDINNLEKVILLIQEYTGEKKIIQNSNLFDIQFKGTFQNANIGMAIVSLDGKILEANNSFCAFLDLNNIEIKNTTFQEITHPEDLLLDTKQLRRCLAGEISSYTIEKRYFNKIGNTVWGRLTATLIRDNENEPIHFISHIEDITDLKVNDQIITEVNTQIMTILNAETNVGIFTTTKNGTFKQVSKGTYNLLGYDVDDLSFNENLLFFITKIIKKDNHYNLKKLEQNLIDLDPNMTFEEFVRGVLSDKVEQRICVCKCKNQKEIYCELVTNVIKDEKDEITGYVFFLLDISSLLSSDNN